MLNDSQIAMISSAWKHTKIQTDLSSMILSQRIKGLQTANWRSGLKLTKFPVLLQRNPTGFGFTTRFPAGNVVVTHTGFTKISDNATDKRGKLETMTATG
ncbi:MAG: hypothetical protein RJA81_1340 [Planctomycetota bacterium]